METITHRGDTFQIVDTVPLGYEIWNIGKNMLDGYLPFCRLSAYQPFPGGRNIETDTLKAIRCEGAQTILAAASSGIKTIPEMEAFIEAHQDAKPGSCAYADVQRFKEALPFMKQLRWS